MSDRKTAGERIDDAISAQDIELKGKYARWVPYLLIGQLVAANTLMFLYAGLGRDWDVPPEVIITWLSASVVEVVGIALVVTRYLEAREE